MATVNTLKGTKWTVQLANSGSQGQLSLGNDTSGTFSSGGNSNTIVWGELWNGNYCALWVVFKSQIDDNVIRIWGLSMSMSSGSGMAAQGNASPQTQSDTSFQNDFLSLMPQAS